MIYFSEDEIDRLVEDDVPLGDLTSYSLGIGNRQGTITLKARHSMVISGTEEVSRLYTKNDLDVTDMLPSGTQVDEGKTIISAKGCAAGIHMVWRPGVILLEYASGIATRTRKMVDAAAGAGRGATVAGTRKSPPYMKKIAIKALLSGGGVPHRTGLSDSILLFNEHRIFLDDTDLAEVIRKLKVKQKEKKVVAEAHSPEEAVMLINAGADVLQLDKAPIPVFTECVSRCRSIRPDTIFIAAGGINGDNAAQYAEAGADILVTSWMYFGKPADIKAIVAKA